MRAQLSLVHLIVGLSGLTQAYASSAPADERAPSPKPGRQLKLDDRDHLRRRRRRERRAGINVDAPSDDPSAPRLALPWKWAQDRSAPSRIQCFLRGQPVSHAEPADCHGRPPFWDWWRDYRNCFATNICLYQGKYTMYSGTQAPSSLGLPGRGPVACNNWHGSSHNATVASGNAPMPTGRFASVKTIWYARPALHVSRTLPGHYGHDVLNNYYYAFITFAEAGLEEWLEPSHAKPFQFVTNNDQHPSSAWFDTVKYDQGHPDHFRARHCFDTALLSASHTHGADLLFLRSSASRGKRWAWWRYRGLQLRHNCPGCEAQRPSVLRPLPVPCGGDAPPLKITILYRTTPPGSSIVVVANGRGRRISNRKELATALGKFGVVTQAAPGEMSVLQQQQLMLSTDVLVTRMSSTTIGAMCVLAPQRARAACDSAGPSMTPLCDSACDSAGPARAPLLPAPLPPPPLLPLPAQPPLAVPPAPLA